MAQAGPYGIEQFDAAGVLGTVQAYQQNRIHSMVLQKQVEAQERATKTQQGIQAALQRYATAQAKQAPTAPDAASGAATAASAYGAAPAPATAAPDGAPTPAGAPDAAAAPTATPAPPAEHPYDRKALMTDLLALDPQSAGQIAQAFSQMDDAEAKATGQKNAILGKAAFDVLYDEHGQPRSDEDMQEAYKHIMPQLVQGGIIPQDHAGDFQPTRENLTHILHQSMDVDKLIATTRPDLMAVGDNVIDKNHPEKGAVYSAPGNLKTIMVHNADGSETPYAFDEKTGKAFQLRDGGAPGDPAAGASGGAPGGFDHAIETVLHNEGGYNPSDMNGKPVNFGINEGANPPSVLKQYGASSVKDLTREQAKRLYHDRYWVPSGAENLPPNLQTPYFDVYIRNPKFAQAALKRSGGDPARFMALSSAYFQKLAGTPSGAKYGRAWANRDANNTAIASGGGGTATPGTLISGKPAPHDAGDDETAKFIGGQVALGQPMPPLGMGKEAAAMRRQILAEATKQWKQMGISPGEANVIAAQNKSGLAELAKIAQMKATVQTAENTAVKNADQVIGLLGSAGTSGSPIFNSWQQAGRRATGDSKVSAFDVAVKTLSTEYARVMSGGGSTQLSDSARHEADALIHTSMTPDQFRAAIRQMKIDMANRTAGIEQERQQTLEQIKTGGRAQPHAAAPHPAGHSSGWGPVQVVK